MIIRSDEEKNEVKEMVGADVERIMALTLPSISRLFIVFHPSSLICFFLNDTSHHQPLIINHQMAEFNIHHNVRQLMQLLE